MENNQQAAMREKYAETIRCMSVVFDDIAAMLNLPKSQHGDPDALMDAIEALQGKATRYEDALREAMDAHQTTINSGSYAYLSGKVRERIMQSLATITSLIGEKK